MVERGGWNFWVQQVAWGTSKDLGDTAAYDIGGWGATAGVERALGGAGFAGITIGAALGHDDDGSTDNVVSSEQYEIAAHWRGRWRSEERTSEHQSLMRISYAVFCLKHKTNSHKK